MFIFLYQTLYPGPATLFFFNFLNLFLLTFIYFLRVRETEHEQGRYRERETQNQKQAPGSELSAQSPMRGSNPQTEIMTQAEVGCLTN